MKPIPMVVVVFELPDDADESAVHKVLDEYTKAAPCDIDALHVFGMSPDLMKEFRDGLASGRMRDKTQELLRRLGEEGEAFIRNELKFHFIWTSSEDPDRGTVHMLFIVPDSDVLAAGLCLNRLRPAVN